MKLNSTFGFDEDFSIEQHGSSKFMVNLQDGNKNGLDTKVIIKDHRTGEVLFEGKNKTMIAGSEFMAMRMFDISGASFTSPTYNTQLGLDCTQTSTGKDVTEIYKTLLFCMGKDGCNRESAIWYPVENKRWIDVNNIVPFQYPLAASDLSATEREIYFGRKDLPNDKRVAYYFKRFSGNPVMYKTYDDGSPWTSTIYSDNNTLKARVSITNSLHIDETDGRDYFYNTTGINDAIFNSIELCAAWGGVINGYTYYQDIRPVTRINFPNKYLNDLTASWDIVYTIYF